jgi:ATP adenylyltransferase
MNHDNLWAPWRGTYLRELARRAEQPSPADGEATNFLAAYWRSPESDEVNHVVYRDESGFILLNRYPYANGHLLAALGDPRPTLLDYEPPARLAFWRLVEVGMDLMQRALRPQGINVGVNQGRAAGAGVPEHLHAHIVPRWNGDTNFMSVIGGIRVIPDALEAMARQYRDATGA